MGVRLRAAVVMGKEAARRVCDGAGVRRLTLTFSSAGQQVIERADPTTLGLLASALLHRL